MRVLTRTYGNRSGAGGAKPEPWYPLEETLSEALNLSATVVLSSRHGIHPITLFQVQHSPGHVRHHGGGNSRDCDQHRTPESDHRPLWFSPLFTRLIFSNFCSRFVFPNSDNPAGHHRRHLAHNTSSFSRTASRTTLLQPEAPKTLQRPVEGHNSRHRPRGGQFLCRSPITKAVVFTVLPRLFSALGNPRRLPHVGQRAMAVPTREHSQLRAVHGAMTLPCCMVTKRASTTIIRGKKDA